MRYDVALAACKSYEDAEVSAALETAVTAAGRAGLGHARDARGAEAESGLRDEAGGGRDGPSGGGLRACADAAGARGARRPRRQPWRLYNAAHLQRVYDVTGLRAAEALGAELNGDFSVCSVSYPEAVQARSFTETAYLRNADAIIDVCKLKTHG